MNEATGRLRTPRVEPHPEHLPSVAPADAADRSGTSGDGASGHRRPAERGRVRLFPTPDVAFLHIPKNSCSTVLATLLRQEGIDPSGFTLDELHLTADLFPPPPDQRPPTLVVLRDPLRRFVSATQHKLLAEWHAEAVGRFARHPTMAVVLPRAERCADGAVALDRITFDELTTAVSLMADHTLEWHFRSQSFFVAGRQAQHVVCMERPGWQQDLAAVIGPLVEFRPHATTTRALPAGAMPDAADTPLGELRARFLADGVLPAPEDLLTPAVAARLARRFAADLALVAPHR